MSWLGKELHPAYRDHLGVAKTVVYIDPESPYSLIMVKYADLPHLYLGRFSHNIRLEVTISDKFTVLMPR